MRRLVDEMTEQKRKRGRQTRSRPILGSVVAIVMLLQSLAAIILAQMISAAGISDPASSPRR